MRTLYDYVLENGHQMFAAFIDFSAAFDSLSHKFIDKSLDAAGVTDKTRAMFRAIYSSATARTAVPGIDGETVLSDLFPVKRGVVQGDITSPMYFILALALIMHTHDTRADKGVELCGRVIHSLGYADDIALVDTTMDAATARVTAISQGARDDADMNINVGKTEAMHVCEQGAVTTTTSTEAKKVCKHKCKNPGCSKVFYNIHGAKCHQGRCRWKNTYAMDSIVEAVETTDGWRYRVRWHGYGPEEDTWEPHCNLPPEEVKDFRQQNGLYDYSWPTDARCQYCNKKCASARGAKIHGHKCPHRPDVQSFAGTCADRKVREDKVEAAQALKAKVICEDRELKNVARFKYLGSIFSADGSQGFDLRRRIGMAMNRCGTLRHVLDSNGVPLSLKLKIYAAAVVSIMTYGCEAWNLDERTRAQLNGANARCLSRFTGKSSHEEASKTKRTFDMVAAVRKRRHQWLGHILRMQRTHDDKERLVKLAVRAQYHLQLPGNLCADAPATDTFEELEQLAQNRTEWSKHWDSIAPAPPAPITAPDHATLPDATLPDATLPDASPSRGPGRWMGSGVDAVWVSTTEAADASDLAGRWLGDGPDAIWVAGRWEGSGADAVWVNESDTKPNAKPNAKPKQRKRKRNQKKKKKQRAPPKGWTDAQRQEWARNHYIANHGNPEDNRPLDVDWSELVEEANASAHTAAPEAQPTPTMTKDTTATAATEQPTEQSPERTPGGTSWAAPAMPPSPSPPCERTSGGTLWAAPAIPPSPTPLCATTQTVASGLNTTPDNTTTITIPPRRFRRAQRQLFPTQQW